MTIHNWYLHCSSNLLQKLPHLQPSECQWRLHYSIHLDMNFQGKVFQKVLNSGHMRLNQYDLNLTQTLTHYTRPSLRLKANNESVKKSCDQLSKSCKNLQNSHFQIQFCLSKIIRIFLFFFSMKNLILGAHLLLLTFFGNFNF